MTLDLMLLGLIVVSALLGYHSGAVRQLSLWVGLVAACFGTQRAAAELGPRLGKAMGWAAVPSPKLMALICFVGLFLAAGMLARLILNLIEPGEERGPLDQGLGVVVGAAKGAAILFSILCLAATFEATLVKWRIDLPKSTQGSTFMSLARSHNIFGPTRALKLS